MSKNLTYVGGSKGGTGKSLFSMALVDYIRKTFPGEEIFLAETDSSNPDVGRLYKNVDGVITDGFMLDEDEKGWIMLADAVDETTAKHIVVNSMAASNLGIRAQGSLFEESLKKMGVGFNAFWVMNRNKDSVTLLRDFLNCVKTAAVYPVLNLYFGKEEEFMFYRSSYDVQEIVGERRGRQLVFPNLNDLIADKLYTDEVNFENLPLQLRIGMRTSLERWLHAVQDILNGIYLPPLSEEATNS